MSKSHFSDFDVLQQLGKGSFGTVHKVRRRATQEIFVMKLISIKQLGPRGQQEAQNEVTILSSLRHPYIVQYYDSFVENKTLHIVMEFCEKGDLSAVITAQKRSLIPEAKVWKYFIQMCLGLEYIHAKKILHRDIKTLNVFLMRDESLRIGDLGVAKKLMNTAAFAHTIVGTPYYLSPELCEDKPYNIKSDIWALGCVLYELCTLKHPFEANNQAALFMKIVRAMYTQIPDSYSADLKKVVNGCLSRDYRKRPSCDEILRMPGMRERALGLNILIPEDSVLSNAALPIPPAPPVVDIPMMHRGALPVIFEEAKEVKKPAQIEERFAKPGAYVNPGLAREFPKPKPNPVQPPLAVVDMRLDIEAAKKQIPKSNEKAVKPPPPPVKPAKPVAVAAPVAVPQKPAAANPQAVFKPLPANSPVPIKPPVVISPVPAKSPQANSPVPMPVPQKPSQANAPVPAPVKAFVPPPKSANPQQRVVKAPIPVAQTPAQIQRPAGKGIPRPSSAVPHSKEELDEIKQVEELPKKPSVNDLREDIKPPPKAESPPKLHPLPSPVASPVIKTNPWKPPIARPVSAHPAAAFVSKSPESSESEESVDGTETPEDDDLSNYDWNATFSGHSEQSALPTYKSDAVSKESFKVVYVGEEQKEDSYVEDLDDMSVLDERHRKLLIRQRQDLVKSIEDKRAEVIRQIGRPAYDVMYPFFKSKVESDELLEMDQNDLNAFMLSQISMENISAMGPLYIILDLENRLLRCEENIKAIDTYLNS